MPVNYPYTEHELHQTGAETATGNGSNEEIIFNNRLPDGHGDMRFYLNVSAAAGTSPTLDIDIEGLIDGVFHVLGSFSQKTAASSETLTIAGCPKTIREVHTITGSAGQSFTFTVSGHRY